MRTALVVGNSAAVLATLTFVVATLDRPAGRPAPREELVVIARAPDAALAAHSPAGAPLGDPAPHVIGCGSGGHYGLGRPARWAGPGGGVLGPPAPPGLGALLGRNSRGEEVPLFPLERTELEIDVAGWLASTVVRQTFGNPFPDPIEAVYVFPLPADAAVHDFLLETPGRRIVGVVRPRAEAERVYEVARSQGRTASLLVQERPNVFRQSVANLAPGARVQVSVTLGHALQYRDGALELAFPTVVAGRYDPAGAPRETAPVGKTNHELSIRATIDAGVPLAAVTSPTHEIEVRPAGGRRVEVRLRDGLDVPDRDFVLRCAVGADAPRAGLAAHRAPGGGGFFAAWLVPQLHPSDADVRPREITFVLDSSGSMAGLPLDASRRLVRRALAGLRSADRFNLIEFAGGARALADAPLAVTEDALRGAEGFLDHLQGAGGTEMLEGVRAVVEQPFDRAMVRIVCFLTDGLVANEAQILELIRRRGQDARWFAFGIGGSVNRELIEGIAEAGRGACEVVLPDLAAAAEAAAERFFRRLDAPVLSDVTFDRGALPIMDVEPARLPDLFAGEAILVSGRFSEAGAATVHFRARANGREVAIPCAFELPAAPPPRPAIGAHWAGRRIHALTRELAGAEGGAREELRARITDLALEFRLVSPFTSFVAVDEAGGGVGRPPVRVLQPVALPRGMTPDSAHGPALGACVTRVPLWGLTLLELPGDGLVVTDVSADGAAARAGARAGSVLVSVGGNRVLGASHLDALLRRLQGETVAVGFREAGGPETVCRLARPEALER